MDEILTVLLESMEKLDLKLLVTCFSIWTKQFVTKMDGVFSILLWIILSKGISDPGSGIFRSSVNVLVSRSLFQFGCLCGGKPSCNTRQPKYHSEIFVSMHISFIIIMLVATLSLIRRLNPQRYFNPVSSMVMLRVAHYFNEKPH